jgi:hypothetical protein
LKYSPFDANEFLFDLSHFENDEHSLTLGYATYIFSCSGDCEENKEIRKPVSKAQTFKGTVA